MFEVECDYYLQGEEKISEEIFIGVKKVSCEEHEKKPNLMLWHNRIGHFHKLPTICQAKGGVENALY